MIKGGRVVRSPTIRPIRKSGSTPKLRFRLDYWLDLSSLRQASLRQIPRSAIHSRFPGRAHLASRPRCDIRHGVVVWWVRQLGRVHPRCSSSELLKPAESGFVGCTDGESISRRAFQVAVGGRHRREPNGSTYLTSPRFVVAAAFIELDSPRPLTIVVVTSPSRLPWSMSAIACFRHPRARMLP